MRRLLSLLVLFLSLGLAAVTVQAAQAWDEGAFAKAQEAGSSILVHVTAPWCPVCKAQKPTVDKLESTNPGLKVFAVDFDRQKDVLKRFGVTAQSTLIAFHGKTEITRTTGITDPTVITEMVLLASH